MSQEVTAPLVAALIVRLVLESDPSIKTVKVDPPIGVDRMIGVDRGIDIDGVDVDNWCAVLDLRASSYARQGLADTRNDRPN